MEVSVEEENKSIQTVEKESITKRKVRYKSNLQTQSLNSSPTSSLHLSRKSSFFHTARKWEPIVEHKRQFVLQSP